MPPSRTLSNKLIGWTVLKLQSEHDFVLETAT